jgi:nitrogenase molybdenum-iron protein alpha/beta subunit
LETDHKGNPKFEIRNRRKPESAIPIPRVSNFGFSLSFALGFAKACDAVALFPLTAFLEKFEPLKTLQNISFSTQSGGCAQAAML